MTSGTKVLAGIRELGCVRQRATGRTAGTGGHIPEVLGYEGLRPEAGRTGGRVMWSGMTAI